MVGTGLVNNRLGQFNTINDFVDMASHEPFMGLAISQYNHQVRHTIELNVNAYVLETFNVCLMRDKNDIFITLFFIELIMSIVSLCFK